ncbi:MAG: hypothetical protein H6814_08975 [Phycisphaeraceae bacterium]|nr:hypothetical protein [Phycisphaeraceae bacterium]
MNAMHNKMSSETPRDSPSMCPVHITSRTGELVGTYRDLEALLNTLSRYVVVDYPRRRIIVQDIERRYEKTLDEIAKESAALKLATEKIGHSGQRQISKLMGLVALNALVCYPMTHPSIAWCYGWTGYVDLYNIKIRVQKDISAVNKVIDACRPGMPFFHTRTTPYYIMSPEAAGGSSEGADRGYRIVLCRHASSFSYVNHGQ